MAAPMLATASMRTALPVNAAATSTPRPIVIRVPTRDVKPTPPARVLGRGDDEQDTEGRADRAHSRPFPPPGCGSHDL